MYSYTYDAENQQTLAAGVTYGYDGDGKRVEKVNSKIHWFGLGSDPLLETDWSGNLQNEYIMLGGSRIARRDSGSNVQSGDLSVGDTRTVNPDGSVTTTTVQGDTAPDIQTTTSSSTFNGVTTTSVPETTLTGATITIDDRTGKGDVPGVMVHESVHAREAKTNPAQFSKDAAAEKSLPYDRRPQEQRANAAQKADTKEIQKAVKQIEKDRKKEN